MATATTSSSKDDRAPSTPQEKAAAAEYAKKLDAELDAQFAREDGVDAPKTEQEEPVENLDSENETEQEQEKPESEESDEGQTPEETIEAEKESEPTEDPKEKRYREQLAGERKANAELQARLQELEAKIVTLPQQQKELSPEEQQLLQEKQYLKEKYGFIDRKDVEALEMKVQSLLDARLRPVQKKREETIFQNIYKKFPDVSPDKDTTNEKWEKVSRLIRRFEPINPSDPLDDYEERFEWAYEKTFGKKAPNIAQARQASYTGIGGGSSAAKSRTTVGNDKDAHFSPSVRAYKAQLDAYFDKEEKEEEARKKRK